MTDNALPDPLVPAEVDLRDFPGMWVDTDRLLRSDTWILGGSDEKAAAITLWLESWHQVPAASLPNNDRVLAKLSQAERWKKTREHALRGWVPCNDGRLYHPVVAEKALEAWIEKLAAAISGATGNAKRWQVEVDTTGLRAQFCATVDLLRRLNPASRTLKKKVVAVIASGSPPQSRGDPGESGGDADETSGGDRNRQGPDRTGTETSLNGGGDNPAPVSAYGAIAKALRGVGIQASPGTLRFRTLVDAGATVEEFLAMAPGANGKDNPFAYLLGAVEGERKRAAQTAPRLHRGPMPQAPPRSSAVDRQIATMNALTGKDRSHERPTASEPADVIDVAARTVA